MKRQRPHRDTTAERASTSSIGFVLSSLRNRREVGVVIHMVVWALSLQDTARRMGITEAQAERLLIGAISRLRHPSTAVNLRTELEGGSVARSRELRRWANAVAQSIVVTCPCGRKFLPESFFLTTGGRPKRYCSNACRQAAYRARKRQSRNL